METIEDTSKESQLHRRCCLKLSVKIVSIKLFLFVLFFKEKNEKDVRLWTKQLRTHHTGIARFRRKMLSSPLVYESLVLPWTSYEHFWYQRRWLTNKKKYCSVRFKWEFFIADCFCVIKNDLANQDLWLHLIYLA